MVNLDITYVGDLRCFAVHGPSSNQLTTDAPRDNHGLGQAFSPTDLVGTALGSCLLTVMGIAARAKQIDLKGTTVHVEKEMTVDLPRRIARLTVEVNFPPQVAGAIADTTRRDLEHIAKTCPVRLSISDQIDVPMTFNWQH